MLQYYRKSKIEATKPYNTLFNPQNLDSLDLYTRGGLQGEEDTTTNCMVNTVSIHSAVYYTFKPDF